MPQTLFQVRQQFRFRGSNILCLIEPSLCDADQHITQLKQDGFIRLDRLNHEIAREIGVVKTSLERFQATWQPVAFVVAKHAIEIAVACPVQKKLVVELIEAEFGIAFVKLNEVDLCSIYDNRSEAKICSGRKEPIDTFAIE